MARADALFELADAVLCVQAAVTSLAEYRRGHGALYDAVDYRGIDVGRVRTTPPGLP